MKQELNLLIIENAEEDAELILHYLRNAGYALLSHRVETKHELDEALSKRKWDLVISDFSLPTMNGLEALALVKQKGGDVPFIMVSGQIGEDRAVEVMRAGADDFILKGRSMRLVPAVERELRDAEIRRQKRAAEGELSVTETRYRELFENMSDGVIVLHPVDDPGDFIIREFNRAAESIERMKRDAVVGHTVLEVLPGLRESGLFGMMQRIRKTGKAERIVDVFYRGAQASRWVNGYIYRLPSGDIVMVYGDVTDRHLTADLLRQSEEKYRTLFETMPQGVVYQDSEGRIISTNPASRKILGWTEEQESGRFSLHPKWRAIREDGTELTESEYPVQFSLRTGLPVKNMVMGLWNPTRRDYQWILVNSIPQFSPGESRPSQVCSTYNDITDKKRAEKKLARLNRLHAMRISLGEIVDYLHDRRKLFEDVCRIAIEIGGFSIVGISLWVKGRLAMMSQRSRHPCPLRDIEHIFKSDFFDKSPGGKSLREGRVIVLPDLTEDEYTLGWREGCRQTGSRSFAAFPIKSGARVDGMISFFSGDPSFFEEEEIKSLEELSSVLSLAHSKIGVEENP
ncbi:MAG TPA: PAS domain S-box protein [Elusimicrobiota bacterium]|nr:PAS domain S-box protein [Elusimicrobiota bacterium]